MKIKHMPCGLFPHFDCGFERRPYLVKQGEKVLIGCRLDDERADGVHLHIRNRKLFKDIKGQSKSRNDQGQKYYQFEIDTREMEGKVEYQFINSMDEKSKMYSFELLHEVIIKPKKVLCSEESIQCHYEMNGMPYEMRIQASDSIRLIFESYLNVKVDDLAKKKIGSIKMKDIILTVDEYGNTSVAKNQIKLAEIHSDLLGLSTKVCKFLFPHLSVA